MTTYSYDEHGQLQTQTDARGNQTTYTGYNSFGIVISQRDDAWGGSVSDSNFSRNTFDGMNNSANNIWLRNNIFDSNGRYGIQFYAPASYNQITDNRITGNGGEPSEAGIYLPAGANVNLIARNTLVANSPSQITDNGAGNRIATFVSDVGPSVTNPLSNVVY